MSADVTPPSADVTSPFDPLGALVAGREVGAPECRPSDARGGHLAPPARKAGRHCPRCRRRHLARCGGRQRVPGSAAATGNETLANAYYAAMDQLANNLMPAAAIANLATGLLLVLATTWGLFRHWWILVRHSRPPWSPRSWAW
jgi:hypothetical protein